MNALPFVGQAVAFVAAAAMLGGCIRVGIGGDQADLPAIERHALDVAPVRPRAGDAPALAVRTFGARSRYDVHVVRRDGPDDFAYLDFERWSEPPVESVTVAVREGLAASRAFRFVAAADDALATDLFLDGYVLAFDLVPAASGPWKARFAARLTLSDRAGAILHSAAYESVRDLPEAGPRRLGPAMAAAIGDVLDRTLADWTARGVLVAR